MDDVTPDLAHSPAKPGEKPQPPAPPLTRLRRFAKRAMFVGLGLLVIAVVVFFMLPVWMSNQQGRAYVLSRLNKRMNGVIAVESWSLSWFSGTDIRNLTLTVDGKTILTCPHIKTDLGLWSLLSGNFDLGNTRLDSPQLTIAKYSDGSTDISRLMLPPAGSAAPHPFQTLAGYIVCNNGSLELTSPGGGPSLLLRNGSAEIPIASRTAPIHLKANGMTTAGGTSQPFSLVADLPSSSNWTSNPYALLLSIQFRAGGLPTATLAEWLDLDPRWDHSLGPTLTAISLMSEPQDASSSIVTLNVKGTIGNVSARANISARSMPAGSQVMLTLVDQTNPPPLSASVRLSPPVLELLAHVNPVLADVTGIADLIEIVSGSLSLDLLRPATAAGHITLRLPSMTLTPKTLLGDILALSGSPPPATLGADTNPLILTLADGRVTLPEMVLTLTGRPRLSFSGSIGFDDSVDLILKTSLPTALGSGSLRIPITGTTRAPHMEQP